MDMLLKAKDWVMARVGERTSLDGLLLIGGCLSVILFGGLAKIAAWVGLVWGVYTLVKSD
mgnify:CR=1 FL=1|tara:strand:- start:95 stop:274 length:180 start_codon:yes stop_codon:yes gene_type:complete